MPLVVPKRHIIDEKPVAKTNDTQDSKEEVVLVKSVIYSINKINAMGYINFIL